jgi:hypothetical protein
MLSKASGPIVLRLMGSHGENSGALLHNKVEDLVLRFFPQLLLR